MAVFNAKQTLHVTRSKKGYGIKGYDYDGIRKRETIVSVAAGMQDEVLNSTLDGPYPMI